MLAAPVRGLQSRADAGAESYKKSAEKIRSNLRFLRKPRQKNLGWRLLVAYNAANVGRAVIAGRSVWENRIDSSGGECR